MRKLSNVTALQSITLALLLGTLGSAWAGPKCTEEPQDKWLTAEKMTKIFTDLGYKDDVKKLHVSSGKCWEIYGHDREGKAVEIYFPPPHRRDRRSQREEVT